MLVVIAVLMVLIAILMPTMRHTTEAARRAVCASNLHQWGVSWFAYSTANRLSIPETVTNYNGRYPTMAWIESTARPTELSHDQIKGYLPGVNTEDKTIGKVWTCPSNREDFNLLVTTNWGLAYVELAYSYYAGVSRFAPGLTNMPGTVTDKRLGRGDRVFMADTLYRWWIDNSWTYNHSDQGASIHKIAGINHIGMPTFSGINRLMGDGSVGWKGREMFNPEAMNNGSATQAWIRGGGSGIPDSSFY
jgi:hypothetical protein